MKYWRINTDSDAQSDVKTCDLWYKFGMAFAGDYRGNKNKHDTIFRKLSLGDGVFMHHSDLGLVGYGVVTEQWDQKTYEGNDKLLYNKTEKDKEAYEYRITVAWASDCDCRENPLPISGRLPYMGTYSHVDQKKWNVVTVLQELRTRTSQIQGIEPARTQPEEEKSKMITTDEINKILSCIGKKVSFKYPGNEGDKHGILKDRAVIESTNEPNAVPYWDVVDLIEFKGEEEPEWIRIGYYRKPNDTLNWGSQTTITEPVSIWKRILVNAASEKKWFQDLLAEVMNELKKNAQHL